MNGLGRVVPDPRWVHPRGLLDKVQTVTRANGYAGGRAGKAKRKGE